MSSSGGAEELVVPPTLAARLLEAAGEPIAGIDADFRISSWNPAAQRAFGWSAAEAIGRSIEWLVAADRPAGASTFLPHLEHGSGIVEDVTVRRRDDTTFRARLTLTPLHEGDDVDGHVAVFTDIDRTRTLELALLRETQNVRTLRQVIDGTNDAGSVDEAIEFTLGAIARHLDWPCGIAWRRTSEGMRPLATGFTIDGRYDTILAATRMTTTDPFGVDVEAGPEWDALEFDPVHERRMAARDAGIGTRLTLPVVVHGRVEAGFELFAIGEVTPDRNLVWLLPQLARHLGRAVERRYEQAASASDRAMLAHIVDTDVNGLAVFDHHGVLTFANEATARILGVPRNRLPGHDLRGALVTVVDADGERYAASDYPAQRVLRTGHPVVGEEMTVETRHGTRLLHVNASPLVLGDLMTGVVVSMADITDRRTAQHAKEIADTFRELAELKNHFLSAVSHELRTPLTVIHAGALTLDTRWEILDEDTRMSIVRRVLANSYRLDRILGDLLDLNRFNHGRLILERRTTDLSEIVTEAIEVSELATTHLLTTDLEPATLRIDRPKIERVILNLLTNAGRHTPNGTEVRVQVEAFDNGALVTVSDAGPGVPDRMKNRVFEPFEQGDLRDAHSPGVGIGLSLVATFVSLHDGRAWVEDGPEGGAVFRVWLPQGEDGAHEGPFGPSDAPR